MLSQSLQRLCFKLAYMLWVLMGFVPGLFDTHNQTFRTSRIYLCYSAVVHWVCLLLMASSSPTYLKLFKSRTQDGVLVAFTTIRNLASFLSVFFVVLTVWSKRLQAIRLFDRYHILLAHQMQFDSITDEARRYRAERMRSRAQLLCTAKFLTGCTYYVLHICLVWQQTVFSIGLQAGEMYAYFFLVMTIFSVYVALTYMTQQFQCINMDVQLTLQQLQQWEQRDTHANWMHAAMLNMHSLATMHFECYRLARSILQLSEPIVFAYIMKFFFANMSMIYHAVLFETRSTPTTSTMRLNGCIMTHVFYIDTCILLHAINQLIVSYSETAQLLRISNKLQRLHQSVSLTRVLDQFADRLRCHKLRYTIFGLFELNNASSLCGFVSVLLHAIVFVQFSYENDNIRYKH